MTIIIPTVKTIRTINGMAIFQPSGSSDLLSFRSLIGTKSFVLLDVGLLVVNFFVVGFAVVSLIIVGLPVMLCCGLYTSHVVPSLFFT